MNDQPERTIAIILKVAAAAVLWGYAWLCLRGDAPFFTLFWNEAIMAPLLEWSGGMSWKEYVTDPGVFRLLNGLVKGAGLFLALCGVIVLASDRFPGFSKVFSILGVLLLLTIAALYGIDRIFFAVQFSEYALQWSIPLFGVWWMRIAGRPNGSTFAFRVWLTAAAGITFTAHGLYALGVFPRPGHFVDMTINILSLQETGAIRFLNVMGTLDVIFALLAFVPNRSLRLSAFVYMVVWGLFTTMARWVAHVHFELPWWPDALLEWTPEVLIRFPHFLAPVALILIHRKERQTSLST